mmetsp:Transcript_43451/g.63785  ORF Transcript_43451/g.63785 Transcript_43451/m.63785 type:complete len:235 (-) Transcript_43451:44-748(-)
MTPTTKKNLRFAPEESNSIFLIPTRMELSPSQRHTMWYQREELYSFRKKANCMSRILRWINQNTDASCIQTLSVTNLKEQLQSYSSGDAFSEDDVKKIRAIVLNRKYKGLSYLSRGLEFRMSRKRQHKSRVAIRTILKYQNDVAKNDAVRMSLASQRCSSWATTLALETGVTDAAIAAYDINNKANFEYSSFSKVAHSSKSNLCATFCYRHKNDTIATPTYPMVTERIEQIKVA